MKTLKHLKTFEHVNNYSLKWPSVVSNEDIDKYEDMIMDMMSEDELDERMAICDELLVIIEDEYPEIYDDIEDDVKELTM